MPSTARTVRDEGIAGVDVGSTTVKIVARPRPDAPWVMRVARHHGRPAATLAALCEGALPRRFRLGVTGSGAALIAQRSDAVAVHEVTAAMAAARARHPEVATLVDLGGQDAKLVLFGRDGAGRPTVVMNDRCAAGTGVTLDRCLARLDVDPARAQAAAYRPEDVHPLSARCGVFAETDLVNLARRGVPVDALLSSLFDAVVRANLSALARGLTPKGPALLLGGPHAFLPALADAWRHHLSALWRERDIAPSRVTVPDDALFFPALGAALTAEASRCHVPLPRGAFVRALRGPGDAAHTREDRPFVAAREVPIERPAWRERRDAPPVAPFVLGIDAGSTVTKAVLLDGARTVRMSTRFASGDATRDARAVLDAAQGALDAMGPALRLDAIAVTGYGAHWIGPLVGADATVVETVAHALSARAVAPDAEVVCDIGGQDIKVVALDALGGVRHFEVSSRCCAGIGMALETTARELGVARDAFAARAMSASRAPWFGDGCVVFLDANRVTFQRQGFAPEEILAGLARALPRVVWTQVVKSTALSSLGRVVVLQGGVQHNAAAVRAQAEYIAETSPGARVVLHPLPELAGALGAALHALPRGRERTSARRALRALPVATLHPDETIPCTLCENRCPRAIVTIEAPGAETQTALTGHGCEAGALLDPRAGAQRRRDRDHAVPDLFSHEASALFRADPRARALVPPRRRVRVAIPRALALYRAAPLLRAYLQALGVAPRDILFSPPTSPALWRRGAHHGATDPCFPAKVLLAHAHHLLEAERFDALFVPRVTRALTCVRHSVDCASCPVVAASPALVRASFAQRLAARGIELIDPELDLSRPAHLAAQLHGAFGARLDVSREESDAALDVAIDASARFDASLRARAKRVLDGARHGRGAVLVLGRPYHVDPGISHHVGVELQNLGYPSLSIRALPRDPAWLSALLDDDLARGGLDDPWDIRDLLPESDNSGGAERLWAARVAVRHKRIGIVDLSSFKCAQDAPTSAPIARLVREGGTPYCALHDLDETRPRTSLQLALRTFAHAMQERGLAPWT